MEKLRAPAAMQFDVSNVAEAWRKREMQFETYFDATEVGKKAKKTQAAILLTIAGAEALDIFQTFAFGEGESKEDVETILKKFREYCQPRKNVVFERYRFSMRNQEEGELIYHWVTDLKTRAATCEFGEQRDLLIRDKIVFGVRDERVKERLLREASLTLVEAQSICRAAETSKYQVQEMANEASPLEVHVMRTGKQSQHTPAGRNKPSRPEDKQQGYKAATCRYCGETHPPRRCPASGKTCARCHRRNHLAKVCQQPQWRTDQPRKVNTLQEGMDSEEEQDTLFLAPLFIGNL